MKTVIGEMLKKYSLVNQEEKINAIKEIMQEIILCGLSRGKFFERASFYGGTALRIFYGLDRFSEDLDFSLREPDLNFRLEKYFSFLKKEVAAYGLNVEFSEKKKTGESKVQSAFLKGNTIEHLLIFYGEQKQLCLAKNDIIKIKFEVDIDPPPLARYEYKIKMFPSPHEVNLYDLPSLFAGKLHAVICRNWKRRTKGRDLYDYIFYLQRGAKVNLPHLQAKLQASGALENGRLLTMDILKEMLLERFAVVDYEAAKEDVVNFIRDRECLFCWRRDFFEHITRDYLRE